MKSGLTCGVITGGLMVLGLFGVDDPATTQQLIKDFKARQENMVNCGDLLRANAALGIPRKAHCDKLVFEMVSYVEEILKARGKI